MAKRESAVDRLPAKLRTVIDTVIEGWYADTRIDWEDALYRIEKYSDMDLGTEMDSQLIKDIQTYARQIKNELL